MSTLAACASSKARRRKRLMLLTLYSRHIFMLHFCLGGTRTKESGGGGYVPKSKPTGYITNNFLLTLLAMSTEQNAPRRRFHHPQLQIPNFLEHNNTRSPMTPFVAMPRPFFMPRNDTQLKPFHPQGHILLSPASHKNAYSELHSIFKNDINQPEAEKLSVNIPKRIKNAPLSSLPQSFNPIDFSKLVLNLRHDSLVNSRSPPPQSLNVTLADIIRDEPRSAVPQARYHTKIV